MAVETTEWLKGATGWSYRRLCRHTGVARSSLIRWRDRLNANKPLVQRPGPPKKPGLDREQLRGQVKKLKHRRRRTLGTGQLYREYHRVVSRREFQYMVADARGEANRSMRRVAWIAPGLAWTIDDTGRRGLPFSFRVSMNQVRDLCSRKGLSAKVSERLLPDSEVAEMLEKLFELNGPPLLVKRDNGSNLNGKPVNELFRAHGVIALNSPPHYPRYNGQMEWEQRELKRTMARLLAETEPDPALVQWAADVSLAECNHRPRPCLAGETSEAVFEARHLAMKAYTLQRRKEVYDEITNMAMKIVARGRGGDRLAEQAAWRIAVETWLRRNGLITVSVGGKVLPHYDPLLVP